VWTWRHLVAKVGMSKHKEGVPGLHNKPMAAVHLGHRLWALIQKKKKNLSTRWGWVVNSMPWLLYP
jgi:hypothetical protein